MFSLLKIIINAFVRDFGTTEKNKIKLTSNSITSIHIGVLLICIFIFFYNLDYNIYAWYHIQLKNVSFEYKHGFEYLF